VNDIKDKCSTEDCNDPLIYLSHIEADCQRATESNPDSKHSKRDKTILVTVCSNYPTVFLQAINLTKRRLAYVYYTFLITQAKNQQLGYGRFGQATMEEQIHPICFVQAFYTENTHDSLRKWFLTYLKREALVVKLRGGTTVH